VRGTCLAHPLKLTPMGSPLLADRKRGWLRQHLPFRFGPALRLHLRLVGTAIRDRYVEGPRVYAGRGCGLSPLTELAV